MVMTSMLLVMVSVAAGVTAAEGSLVDTDDGRVAGIVEKSVKGRNFNSFYGIPFARPPVGQLRFKVRCKLLYFRSRYVTFDVVTNTVSSLPGSRTNSVLGRHAQCLHPRCAVPPAFICGAVDWKDRTTW